MKTLKLLSRKEYYTLLRENPNASCSFCDYDNKQIIIAKSQYWVWIVCLAPYWKWHTMFIIKRHVDKIEEVSLEEFTDLTKFKQLAEKRYKENVKKLEDGDPIDMFFYFWRERENGIDKHFKLKKSIHLHLHMVPERDGTLDKITDPEAKDFNFKLLMKE